MEQLLVLNNELNLLLVKKLVELDSFMERLGRFIDKYFWQFVTLTFAINFLIFSAIVCSAIGVNALPEYKVVDTVYALTETPTAVPTATKVSTPLPTLRATPTAPVWPTMVNTQAPTTETLEP